MQAYRLTTFLWSLVTEIRGLPDVGSYTVDKCTECPSTRQISPKFFLGENTGVAKRSVFGRNGFPGIPRTALRPFLYYCSIYLVQNTYFL